MAESYETQILVIEDDPGLGRVLRMAFSASGFNPTVVPTGEAALQILGRDGVKAVATDLILGDGRGRDVLDWLRSHAGNAGSPVWVVMSSMDQQDATQKFGPLGDHFMSKPLDPWNLVGLVKRLLEPA